jgi:hypothetical protein
MRKALLIGLARLLWLVSTWCNRLAIWTFCRANHQAHANRGWLSRIRLALSQKQNKA